jgi:acetyl esterase/lipase
MAKILAAIGLLLLLGGLAYHFAGLAVFNALVPKDAGSRTLAENVSYGQDPRHRLDLYRPDGAGPFPMLFFAYGGSWDSGRRQDYGFVGRAFAAQGYLTAIADYRLVPSVHYPVFVDDTAMAISWLSEHGTTYEGDAHRLFVMGHSAGAYNVMQAVLRNGLKQKVRAMATLAGPFDFLPLDSPKSIAAFSKAADLPGTQPVNLDAAGAPPLLLMHGLADTTVRLRNSESLLSHFRSAGVPAELRVYDELSHVGILLALSRPLRGQAPVFEETVAFFQRYR